MVGHVICLDENQEDIRRVKTRNQDSSAPSGPTCLLDAWSVRWCRWRGCRTSKKDIEESHAIETAEEGDAC